MSRLALFLLAGLALFAPTAMADDDDDDDRHWPCGQYDIRIHVDPELLDHRHRLLHRDLNERREHRYRSDYERSYYDGPRSHYFYYEQPRQYDRYWDDGRNYHREKHHKHKHHKHRWKHHDDDDD